MYVNLIGNLSSLATKCPMLPPVKYYRMNLKTRSLETLSQGCQNLVKNFVEGGFAFMLYIVQPFSACAKQCGKVYVQEFFVSIAS